MRQMHAWLPLLALTLAACSADRSPTAPRPASETPPQGTSRDEIMTIGGAPVTSVEGHAVNDSGVMVGTVFNASPPLNGPAIWTPPDYTGELLPTTPGMGFADATDIANDGTVLGLECEKSGVGCVPTVWRDGAITHITALDTATALCPCDGEVVVGSSIVDGLRHATMMIHGLVLDGGVPDGFTSSIFTAVSHGHFVADATRADGSTAAFRWSPSGGWVMLPEGDHASVRDVNSRGDAIGGTPDGNAFWPGDGSAPVIEPIGTFEAVDDSGLVVGEAPLGIGFPNPEPPDVSGGAFWRSGSGWESEGLAFSRWVDINSWGMFIELFPASGFIQTALR